VKKVYIAGHSGLVGSALVRHVESDPSLQWFGEKHKDLDLTDRSQTFDYFQTTKPDTVIVAAARVGGIMANSTFPVQFLSENLQIMVNILDASHAVGVERLLFLGSSCIYPRMSPQPIREEYLLTGELEPTNESYALAKISGLKLVQAYRKQYGRKWISAMPTNLYGPGDNFDPESSHVLPAMIRRFHEAKCHGTERVSVWGTGRPQREFLHVDDLARACFFLLENYDAPLPINVGTGSDISIKVLTEKVARVVGYAGIIEWDETKPDGTPRKLLDVSRLHSLGWRHEIELDEGLSQTYRWYLENNDMGAVGLSSSDHLAKE
jgi:GDP-L-fucose synthase